MDKNIAEFIQSYGISNLELQDILNLAPMMEVITFDEFMQNTAVLVYYGYPKSDLDFLLLSNPNLFVGNPDDLKRDLIELKKQGDIEVILKQDPYII